MANLDLLRKRLKQFDEKKNSNFIWKPKEGSQQVRIVPYQFNPESPFIELKFYYGIGGKHYVAPCTFGKPDPILEFVNSLRNSGSDEERELAKKLMPTNRTYAPVLVRGEENQGVRFWGFGSMVYKQLLELMTDPNWGDITSWTNGNDIAVKFVKEGAKRNAKTGQAFPDTTILPVPTKTPVCDPTRKDLMEKLKNQTDILTIFPVPSYEELKAALTAYINGDSAAEAPTTSPEPGNDQATTSAPAVTPASQAAMSTANVTAETASEEFEKFFKK